MGISEFNAGRQTCDELASHPGGSRSTPGRFMPDEPLHWIKTIYCLLILHSHIWVQRRACLPRVIHIIWNFKIYIIFKWCNAQFLRLVTVQWTWKKQSSLECQKIIVFPFKHCMFCSIKSETKTNWRPSCKKGIYCFLGRFSFFAGSSYSCNFYQTDLFWHE